MRRLCCGLLFTVLFLSIYIIFLTAHAGTIQTTVTTHADIRDKGWLDFRLNVGNRGDVTAHNVSASLAMSEIFLKYPNRGKNPAGGQLQWRDRIDIQNWKPGWYSGIIRVDFEEQNGTPHFTYHVFDITYDTSNILPLKIPVEISMALPRFNRKAFLNKTDDLTVTVNNTTGTPAQLNVRIFLPDGFDAAVSETKCRLSPDERRVLTFPIHQKDSFGVVKFSDQPR
jgi:hypothetical protein